MMKRIAAIPEPSPPGTVVDPPATGMAEHNTDPPVDAIRPAHRGAVAIPERDNSNSPEEPLSERAGDEQSPTTTAFPGLTTILLTKQHNYPPDAAAVAATTTATTATTSSDLPHRHTAARQSVTTLSAIITPLINVVNATPVTSESPPIISSEERRLRLQQRNLELQLQLRDRELDLERQRVLSHHQVQQPPSATACVGIFIVMAVLLLAVAVVAGVCSAGKCRGSSPDPPQFTARSYAILTYIESISLLTSDRRVSYLFYQK
jgi:hypothetical protein